MPHHRPLTTEEKRWICLRISTTRISRPATSPQLHDREQMPPAVNSGVPACQIRRAILSLRIESAFAKISWSNGKSSNAATFSTIHGMRDDRWRRQIHDQAEIGAHCSIANGLLWRPMGLESLAAGFVAHPNSEMESALRWIPSAQSRCERTYSNTFFNGHADQQSRKEAIPIQDHPRALTPNDHKKRRLNFFVIKIRANNDRKILESIGTQKTSCDILLNS